jgi:hypothetical protein
VVCIFKEKYEHWLSKIREIKASGDKNLVE